MAFNQLINRTPEFFYSSTYGPTYRVVTVSGGEDPVMGIGQNAGEGSLAGPLWPVEHLGLQPVKEEFRFL